MMPDDYIKYAVKNNLVTKLSWYYTFMAILDDNFDNEYLTIKDGICYAKVNGELEELQMITSTPIYNFRETIHLSPDDISNLNTEIDTTIGRYIMNKVLLSVNFGNKIEYINDRISVSGIESKIVAKLKTGEISVDEYINFTNSVTFFQGLSKITNISATPRNIVGPPNFEKIKKELRKEYDNLHGKNWIKDRIKVLEFQNKLKEVDKDWIKDDPTYGKLLNNKIVNNSRVKMYLTYGPEVGFNKDGSKMTFVENSLSEQYPEDTEQLTALFNSSRSGSFDRGHETRKGGTAAKEILRATNGLSIHGQDCGTTLGKRILVTNANVKSIIGRYIIKGGKPFLIENGDEYIGKEIIIRSPMYCKNPGTTFCSTCVGTGLSDFKSGISLTVLNISNILLTISLKSMHNTQVSLHNINITDVIK